MDELIMKVAGYGLPGLIVAILCLFLWHTLKQLRQSEKERVDDAKAFTSLILEVQGKFLDSANKIGDAVERLTQQLKDKK